jgi:hypothetical protein
LYRILGIISKVFYLHLSGMHALADQMHKFRTMLTIMQSFSLSTLLFCD